MQKVKMAKICTLRPAEHDVDTRCDLPHGWHLSAPATNRVIQRAFQGGGTAGPIGIDIPDEVNAVRMHLGAVRVFGPGRKQRAALIVQAVNDAIANAS